MSSAPIDGGLVSRSALAQILPEALDLPAHAVARVNLSPDRVSAAVLSLCARLREMEAAGASVITEQVVTCIERSERFAHALIEAVAHLEACGPAVTQADVRELNRDFHGLRKAVEAAERRSGLRSAPLTRYRPGLKLRHLAFDTLALSATIVQRYAPLREQDLELVRAAERRAGRVIDGLASIEAGTDRVAMATDLRRRVLTLVVESYGALRLALRMGCGSDRERDEVAPSLHVACRTY